MKETSPKAERNRFHLLCLLAVGVLTGLAAWQASTVRMDTSIAVWFLEDDPDLVAYSQFLEVFDSDQIVVMAYRDEQLWTDQGLLFLKELGEAAADLDYVIEARSVVTLPKITSPMPGLIAVERPYEFAPPDPAVLRQRVLGDELLAGLVSKDGLTAAVLLSVDALQEESQLKIVLADSLRELAARFEARGLVEGRAGLKIELAGPTMMDAAFFTYTERDFVVVFPLMLAVIIFVILALFRTPKALILPLAVVLIDCLWVTGLMGLTEQKVTIIHGIIYPLILGIGIASSVHVMSRALANRRAGMDVYTASMTSLNSLLAPCFFTALTTAAGMLSLTTSTLAPLRQFGVLGAVGAFCTFLLTYALGPYLLPLLPAPKAGEDSRSDALWARWDRLLVGLGGLALRQARLIMLIAALLVTFGLAGIVQLDTGSNPVHYYKADDPVRLSLEYVDSVLSGTSNLEILIDTGVEGGVKEPDMLLRIKEAQDFLGRIDGIGTTVSIVDYIETLHRVSQGGGEAAGVIPQSRAQVAQLLLLMNDPDTEAQVVDHSYRRARITARLKVSESDKLNPQIPRIEAMLQKVFPTHEGGEATGMSARATGMTKLISNMDRHLLHSATRSVGLAFIMVLLFMTLALRSVRLGLFSMIPNILPIVMVMGVMGWVGIPLDPGTTMIGAVALGLVVDNTVHFLHPFREFSKAGKSIEEATQATLLLTGRAIVTTTLVLVCAFWLLLLASFNPNVYFGLLCGLAVAFGLVADLVVLPAALMLIRPRLD
jgi:predicted RND superfamily exporter protein